MLISAFLVALSATGATLTAQEEPSRNGLSLRVGGGLGLATSHGTGGAHVNRVGPLVDLQLGVGGRRVQAVFEAHLQPFKLPVPPGEDAVRLMYYLGSLQVFLGRNAYVRGGVGVAQVYWSGPGRAGDQSNIAAGLAVGFETRALGRLLAFEGVWRGTGSLCFDSCGFTGTRLLAVQVLVPFY
jgi:hypothetical protein